MRRPFKKRKQKHPLQIQREHKVVAVLTPCDDHVRTEFAMSLVCLFERTYREPQIGGLAGLYLNALGTTILPQGRQKLADQSLEIGATHLLWIDSDMKFPNDTLLRFLQHDQPLVGINALSRRPPHHPCAQYADGSFVQTTSESSGLEKVHRTGFGVLWMSVEVLRALDRPFFNYEYRPETNDFRGEDFYFFNKAHAAGFEVYVDHDLSKEVQHIGAYGFNPLLLERAAKEGTQ